MKVYVNRQDMTGTERTFANSYRPGEDIIRYNRASKVYKVKVGDYAPVTATNHEKNEITVRFANGRTLTYDPTRLSGVSVYNETERSFAEGDRIQFRAPFADKRIVNGELCSITKIEPEHLRVALDSGREVSFDPQQFRHIDHGYAVTSHSSQGLTGRSSASQRRYARIGAIAQRQNGLRCRLEGKGRSSDLYRLYAESTRGPQSQH